MAYKLLLYNLLLYKLENYKNYAFQQFLQIFCPFYANLLFPFIADKII